VEEEEEEEKAGTTLFYEIESKITGKCGEEDEKRE